MAWPENSKHLYPLYEALQAEYPVLSCNGVSKEWVSEGDDYLEEGELTNIY